MKFKRVEVENKVGDDVVGQDPSEVGRSTFTLDCRRTRRVEPVHDSWGVKRLRHYVNREYVHVEGSGPLNYGHCGRNWLPSVLGFLFLRVGEVRNPSLKTLRKVFQRVFRMLCFGVSG